MRCQGENDQDRKWTQTTAACSNRVDNGTNPTTSNSREQISPRFWRIQFPTSQGYQRGSSNRNEVQEKSKVCPQTGDQLLNPDSGSDMENSHCIILRPNYSQSLKWNYGLRRLWGSLLCPQSTCHLFNHPRGSSVSLSSIKLTSHEMFLRPAFPPSYHGNYPKNTNRFSP